MLKYPYTDSVNSILCMKKARFFFSTSLSHLVVVYILFDFPNFKPEEIYICFTFSNDGLTDETIPFFP